MDHLVAELCKELQQRSATLDAKRHAERAQTVAEPELTPLVDRLQRLIAALPPEVRQRPQSLEFFAQRLRGRNRPTPQRGELGRCLTQIGFTRTRQWRKDGNGFRALWHPPLGI